MYTHVSNIKKEDNNYKAITKNEEIKCLFCYVKEQKTITYSSHLINKTLGYLHNYGDHLLAQKDRDPTNIHIDKLYNGVIEQIMRFSINIYNIVTENTENPDIPEFFTQTKYYYRKNIIYCFSRLKNLPPEQIKGLLLNMIKDLPPEQRKDLLPDLIKELRFEQIKDLLLNLKEELLLNLKIDLLLNLKKELRFEQIKEVLPDLKKDLPSEQIRELLLKLKKDLPPEQIKDLLPDLIKDLPPEQIKDLLPDLIKDLPYEQKKDLLSGLSELLIKYNIKINLSVNI
jgi:hypothetical protein